MRLRLLGALGALGLTGALLFAVSAAGAAGDAATRTYIVQMQLEPVLTYDGGVAGIPATAPEEGEKVDADAAGVERYVDHLTRTHDQALAAVGGAEKVYDYVYSFNGVAAELTTAQAAAIQKAPGVLGVTEDTLHSVDTASTPKFLGLGARNGLWRQLGGEGSAGEDIVIGVVDSGITPESPSFSDRQIKKDRRGDLVYGDVVYDAPDDWDGACQEGESWGPGLCNNKLIGARYFTGGWGGDAGLHAIRPWEFLSPRDFHGHGSHTTSTAGGNHGVRPTGAAAAFGQISGIAPRARVAMYKALYSLEDASTANGWQTDFTAAIDQAVADGVDVINFSVGGTQTDFLNIVHEAFLNAAAAGIFVATSAGNDGPAASSGTREEPS